MVICGFQDPHLYNLFKTLFIKEKSPVETRDTYGYPSSVYVKMVQTSTGDS